MISVEMDKNIMISPEYRNFCQNRSAMSRVSCEGASQEWRKGRIFETEIQVWRIYLDGRNIIQS